MAGGEEIGIDARTGDGGVGRMPSSKRVDVKEGGGSERLKREKEEE